MPDPRQLQIGDRIRFVAVPDEWSAPGYRVHPESVALLEALIARGRSARVFKISEDGTPWINARLRRADGTLEDHDWGVDDATSWVRVRSR